MIVLMTRRPAPAPLPSPRLLDELCPFGPVPGCAAIQARRSTALFALWDAWEEEAGRECPVPFWAAVWPGAQVLARFLLDRPDLVKGREVIEIGCGGAVASIAAKKAGARAVLANDIDPVALAIGRENSERNRVSLHLDGENRVQTGSLGGAQLILCSDFFYTRGESRTLADLLSSCRDRSVDVLIADGGRPFVPADFREVLREEWVDVDADLEGREKRAVRILRY